MSKNIRKFKNYFFRNDTAKEKYLAGKCSVKHKLIKSGDRYYISGVAVAYESSAYTLPRSLDNPFHSMPNSFYIIDMDAYVRLLRGEGSKSVAKVKKSLVWNGLIVSDTDLSCGIISQSFENENGIINYFENGLDTSHLTIKNLRWGRSSVIAGEVIIGTIKSWVSFDHTTSPVPIYASSDGRPFVADQFVWSNLMAWHEAEKAELFRKIKTLYNEVKPWTTLFEGNIQMVTDLDKTLMDLLKTSSRQIPTDKLDEVRDDEWRSLFSAMNSTDLLATIANIVQGERMTTVVKAALKPYLFHYSNDVREALAPFFQDD